MKMKLAIISLVVLTLFILAGNLVQAEVTSYGLSWSAVVSGGGINNSSNYDLNGTAGQPVAGSGSGGNYILNGGFISGEQTTTPPHTEHQVYLPTLLRK